MLLDDVIPGLPTFRKECRSVMFWTSVYLNILLLLASFPAILVAYIEWGFLISTSEVRFELSVGAVCLKA